LPSVAATWDRILGTVIQGVLDTEKRGPPRQPEETATMNVEVPRMRPCPCGSGKRYKHCHGALNTPG
jgi:hypothetical protein